MIVFNMNNPASNTSSELIKFFGNIDQKFIFENLLLLKEPGSLKLCPDIAKDFNWNVSDISHIHPIIALQILRQFGFRKFQEYDNTLDMNVWKIESVDHWLQHFVRKQCHVDEFDTIINECRHVLSYLQGVCLFINNNPDILN